MNDNIDMETPKQSRRAQEPGPPLKDAEEDLKNKTIPPPQSADKDPVPDESQDDEPGTFDRVYEHGRQMGF
jgi:hypothetical protein